MKPNPLRLLLLGYGLALFTGALTGLTGWPLLLALWLGGPALVLSFGLLPSLLPEPADAAGPGDPDIAEWDADLAAERGRTAPVQPVPAAGTSGAAADAGAGPRPAAGSAVG